MGTDGFCSSHPTENARPFAWERFRERGAEAVKFRVETLLAAKLTGHTLDNDTASRVANLNATFADKLAKVELIEARQDSS